MTYNGLFSIKLLSVNNTIIIFVEFKATCVYSSAKYPASDYSPSQTTFPLEETLKFEKEIHPLASYDNTGHSTNQK